MKKTQAFVYKWTQFSTGKWYIGSRTAQGCHPGDGYISSSKVIKPMILENNADWKRELLVIGESTYIAKTEADLLQKLDAMHDPMSFNMHNGDGEFTMTGKIGSQKGKTPWNKGLTKDTTPNLNGGVKKGNVPHNKGKTGPVAWNKGLTKDIDERVAKYADTLISSGNRKGKCTGEDNPSKRAEVRAVLSEQKQGEKNPMFGKAPWNKSSKI